MTTLDAFSDTFQQEPVAWAFELCKFSVFDGDVPDRRIGDWSLHVKDERPDESNWVQNDNIEHRIRNVTPLVHGDSYEDALAYTFTYINNDGEPVTTTGIHDPRGADDLVRCQPLVPKDTDGLDS